MITSDQLGVTRALLLWFRLYDPKAAEEFMARARKKYSLDGKSDTDPQTALDKKTHLRYVARHLATSPVAFLRASTNDTHRASFGSYPNERSKK